MLVAQARAPCPRNSTTAAPPANDVPPITLSLSRPRALKQGGQIQILPPFSLNDASSSFSGLKPSEFALHHKRCACYLLDKLESAYENSVRYSISLPSFCPVTDEM